MPFEGTREFSIALQGTRVFLLFLTVRKLTSVEAISYQKCPGLDIPPRRNQDGAEGRGLAMLCHRGAGDGSFAPLQVGPHSRARLAGTTQEYPGYPQC